MKGYVFTRRALSDVAGIAEHIAKDSPRAARDWIDALEDRCGKLAEMPGMGRRREDLERGILVSAFGAYLLFYRENDQGIEIARVLHGSRDIATVFGEP